MKIWIDADACPGEIKEMLYRASQRGRVQVTLVANQMLRTPESPLIDSLLVPGGMNEADRKIVELVSAGDLVITVGCGDVTKVAPRIVDEIGRLTEAVR